ncbi:MAG: 2OG-Fe(II) oxygenase [Immundisolibacterales bacterium]|nr:2OG-Fe(II) oxygenase [Immundisolibacterales bacterium]
MSASPSRAREPAGPNSVFAARIAALDWPPIAAGLDADGHALLPSLLSPRECRGLTALYESGELFRKRVVMSRHGYGRGEYRYFAYPLPRPVEALRTLLYPPLAEIANRWNETLRIDTRFPAAHAQYLERCHRAGQTRPTPLVLRYGEGDYNRLHQDLYGEHVFPFQATVLLSDPARDFEGGEFVLTEQRPRMQSRVEVVPLAQGDAVVFPVHHRPVRGARGFHRANFRHGVSRLRAGSRHTLGIIFHDAR